MLYTARLTYGSGADVEQIDFQGICDFAPPPIQYGQDRCEGNEQAYIASMRAVSIYTKALRAASSLPTIPCCWRALPCSGDGTTVVAEEALADSFRLDCRRHRRRRRQCNKLNQKAVRNWTKLRHSSSTRRQPRTGRKAILWNCSKA